RVAAQAGATPVEVRQALENVGFDFRRFVNPMAAVHTVLKRLVTQGEAMVRTGADGERRFAARRVGVIALTQQEATDEAFMRQLLESPSPELLVQLVSSRRRGK
ncbi:MAG TPA: hypothetical protein VJP86_10020, partial [Vicinamibacterales bacterium]|nr:hypothetical protein [Vicinamibacterales bacterium]